MNTEKLLAGFEITNVTELETNLYCVLRGIEQDP
jgi:hypothetical protein